SCIFTPTLTPSISTLSLHDALPICRHGIHLVKRDRNVIVADCHIYNNTGAGIFFDGVNLHQTNVHGNHISYCKQGGVRIVGSERSEEHTSELQSQSNLVCRLLLEKK